MALFVFPEISFPLKLIFSFVVTLPEHSIQRPPGWLSVRKIINKDYLIPADQKLSKSVSLFHQPTHFTLWSDHLSQNMTTDTHKEIMFRAFLFSVKRSWRLFKYLQGLPEVGPSAKSPRNVPQKGRTPPKKTKPWWEERDPVDYKGPRISEWQRNRSVNSLISGGDNLNRFHEKYSIRAEWV